MNFGHIKNEEWGETFGKYQSNPKFVIDHVATFQKYSNFYRHAMAFQTFIKFYDIGFFIFYVVTTWPLSTFWFFLFFPSSSHVNIHWQCKYFYKSPKRFTWIVKIRFWQRWIHHQNWRNRMQRTFSGHLATNTQTSNGWLTTTIVSSSVNIENFRL